jgi:hypothetical protein
MEALAENNMSAQMRTLCNIAHAWLAPRDLDVFVVQRQESIEQNARIVLSFVYTGWYTVQSKQGVHRGLCGADRIFHGKHHVVREFAELSNVSEVLRALRYYLGAVASASAQKLAGDKRHHARDADATFKDLAGIGLEAKVAHDLGHDLSASACGHRLLHEVARFVDGEAIAPKDVHILGLSDEMGLVRQHDGR